MENRRSDCDPTSGRGARPPLHHEGRTGPTIAAAQLLEIYDASPVMIYVCEADAGAGPPTPIYLSPSFERQLGWSLKEVRGDRAFWPAQIHPDDRERVLAAMETLFRDGEIAQEYRLRHADGGFRWVRDATQFKPGDSGAPGTVVGYCLEVTDQIEACSALRESEARYRGLVENMKDGLVVIDAAGVIRAFNPAAEDMFGYRADEAVGRNVGILMDEGDVARHNDAIENHWQRGRSGIIGAGPRALAARRKDGSTFPVEIAVSEGSLDGERIYVGTVRDKTERKRVEDALLASEASLVNAQRMAHVGSFEWDIAAGTIRWSDELYRIFGLEASDEAPIFETFLTFVHPEDRSRVDGIVRDCLKTLEDAEFEMRIVHRDGGVRYIDSRLEIVLDRDGHPVMLIGISQDVTARRHAETALRESERRYREFAESLPEIIYESDENGVLTFLNRRFYETTGYLPGELSGPYGGLKMLVPEDRERAARAAAALMAGDDAEANEYTLLCKDGRRIPVLFHTSVVHRDGKPAGLRGIVTDISKRKKAEEAMLAAKQEAEMASRAKSEFLANMSHELRTPLNAIIGFSEFIKMETLGPIGADQYREYGDDINESGRHLLAIINDMLDLSKVESGTAELEESIIDVEKLIASVTTLVGERATAAGVILEPRVFEPLPGLRGDDRKIKQILINLLANAIKFSDEGAAVTLTVQCRPGAEYLFEITDTGPGMAVDDIPKALEPFGQIKGENGRAKGGTGLGLPLTKALVELHGGRLELRSAVGIGTTAIVRLPAERIVGGPVKLEVIRGGAGR